MKHSHFVCLFLCLAITLAGRSAQAQTLAVLYNFMGVPDGDNPDASLVIDNAGNLYGTTAYGGNACPSDPNGCGTVFKLSPNGSGGWDETVIYSFSAGADGGYPLANVIFDGMGNLYGTADNGGANGYGVVFELSPVGSNWTEKVLYSFCSQPNCADGVYPISGLLMDSAGNLYGANEANVFELSPSGGSWTEQVIYNAAGWGGLAMDASGNIFGLGYSAAVDHPIAFELSPDGKGGWNPTVLYTFTTGQPWGTPALDKAGNFYGTTDAPNSHNNPGTVYKLSRGKEGKWTKKILHSFKSGDFTPWGVVLDAAGNIYGTTSGYGRAPFPFGTVYELVAEPGTGTYEEKNLWVFNETDGEFPVGGLIWDNAGNLYGTTSRGGTGGEYGNGVVFEVTP
jgi:uncharacterized repeat protein (TIGR03803 family)